MNIREALREAKRLKEEIGVYDVVKWAESGKPGKPSTSVQVKTRMRFDEEIHIHPSKGAYIDKAGHLVIPFDSNPKYHLCAGEQSIANMLAELGVSKQTWKHYTDKHYPWKN